MTTTKFSVDNNLVWAKMKGFPFWPGKICDPPSDTKPRSGHEWVYFFGSKNYGWIERSNINPYEDNKEKYQKSVKSLGVLAAIKEIESYKKGKCVLSPHIAPPKKDKKEPPDANKARRSDGHKTRISNANKPELPFKGRKSEPYKLKISNADKPDLTFKGRKSDSYKTKISNANKPDLTPFKGRKSDSYKGKMADPVKPIKKILVDKSKKRTSTGSVHFSPKVHFMKRTEENLAKTPKKSKEKQEEKKSTPLKQDKVIRKRKSTSSIEPKPKKKSITPKRDTKKLSSSLTLTPGTLKEENTAISASHIGIVGLGETGSHILKHIIQSERKVIIWDDKTEKCNTFKNAGAEVAMTPNDVFRVAPITFCCIEDYDSLEAVVCVNRALCNVKKNDAFVVIHDIDYNRSLVIEDCVRSVNGGRYLEARFLRNYSEADRESLSIVASGDKDVYDDCLNLLQLISSYVVFVGQVGNASKYHAIMQGMLGFVLAGMSEALHLAKNYEVNGTHLLESLEYSPFNCPLIESRIKAEYNLDYTPSFNLSDFKKGLKESVDLSEYVDVRLAGTSCAHSIASCHNEMKKSM